MQYKPCNNTELVLFYAHNCWKCKNDSLIEDFPKCSVLFRMLLLDTDDDQYPRSLKIDACGIPYCAKRDLLSEIPSMDIISEVNDENNQLKVNFDPLSKYTALGILMRQSGLYIDPSELI